MSDTPKATERLAILHGFNNACGGTENEAIELYRLLRDHADIELWALGEPDAYLADNYNIRRISPAQGKFPRHAHLLLPGASKVGRWVYFSRPKVISLIANTLTPARLKRRVRRLRFVPKQDLRIFYVSEVQREAMPFGGTVITSPVDLARFSPNTNSVGGLRLGRLSRDVPYKHGSDDPALYKELAAQGWDIRLRGATCLQSELADVAGVQIEPESPVESESFIAGLDVFFYRTRDDWFESFGRVVLEAMACGVAVVAHRSGGYVDLIEHGRNGFLFETDSEVRQILAELKDNPALLAEIKTAARHSAEAFSSAQSREQLLTYFTGDRY